MTRNAISFLGNVDAKTGMVVDPAHEIYGRCIAGKVLIFPAGKSSTVDSYVIYQLKKRGLAPVAMINIRSGPIMAVGPIISGIPCWTEWQRRLLVLPATSHPAAFAPGGHPVGI